MVGAIKKAPARRRSSQQLCHKASRLWSSLRWRPLQVNSRRLRCRGAIVNNRGGRGVPGPAMNWAWTWAWPGAVRQARAWRFACLPWFLTNNGSSSVAVYGLRWEGGWWTKWAWVWASEAGNQLNEWPKDASADTSNEIERVSRLEARMSSNALHKCK